MLGPCADRQRAERKEVVYDSGAEHTAMRRGACPLQANSVAVPRGAMLLRLSFQLFDATLQKMDPLTHGDRVTDMIEHPGQAKRERVTGLVLEGSQHGYAAHAR
jgi:hypothetical protein